MLIQRKSVSGSTQKLKQQVNALSVQDVDLQVNITWSGSWSDHKLYYVTNEQVIAFDNAKDIQKEQRQ